MTAIATRTMVAVSWLAAQALTVTALAAIAPRESVLFSSTFASSDRLAQIPVVTIWAIALLGAVYLLFSTVVAYAAGFSRSEDLHHLSQVVTPLRLRRFNRWLLGPLVVAMLAQPAASASASPNVDIPVLRHIAPSVADAPSTPTAQHAPKVHTWTVQRGESLWLIAEQQLINELDRPPTENELADYWTALVNVNRDNFATGNPDLIFNGQILRLPN